jgi:hypothetical protein
MLGLSEASSKEAWAVMVMSSRRLELDQMTLGLLILSMRGGNPIRMLIIYLEVVFMPNLGDMFGFYLRQMAFVILMKLNKGFYSA